jgi:hydrogenase-4 membrane subunit HyfE
VASGRFPVSPLLVALLGVLLLPLFFATWRASLFGLAGQGILIAAIVHGFDHAPATASAWLALVDLVVVRALIAPLALYTVLRAQRASARTDVAAPNLLTWTLAFALVLVSFTFSDFLVESPGEQQTLVAVASAGVLLGFLVLSAQSGPFSQMVGALRIENAIVLLERGGGGHEEPLGVQMGLACIFLATVAFFRWYLSYLGRDDPSESPDAPSSEAPTL